MCFLSSVGRVGIGLEVGVSDEGGWISRDGWREEISEAGGGREMEEQRASMLVAKKGRLWYG